MVTSRTSATTRPALHRGTYASERPEPGDVLTVVTWNIQFGLDAAAAAEALATVEPLRSADVVLLQEMDGEGTDVVARRIGADYVYATLGPHRQTGRDFGNAVLSKWSIADPAALVLPHRSAVQGQERLAVGVVVTVGQVPIVACSVHAEVPTLSPPKRRRQFDAIARVDARWPDGPMVIGGDFNTMTRRGVADVDTAMATAGASRVSVGADRTLRRGGREFSLDHVYARALAPVDCGVVHDLDVSDHRPLWVRLRP